MEFIKATKSNWILPLEDRLKSCDDLLAQAEREKSLDSSYEFCLEMNTVIRQLWTEYNKNNSKYIYQELKKVRKYAEKFIQIENITSANFKDLIDDYRTYAVMMSSNAHISEFCLD